MTQDVNSQGKDQQPAISPSAPEPTPESSDSSTAQREGTDEEWRSEFPYPWDEDEVVTCRDTLRFLLGGSGALFLATGVLAIIGNLPASPAAQAVPIAKVSDLTVNGWKVFNFPDQYAEGILIRLSEQQFVAYSDVCTHLSCAVVYQSDGKLHCPCHDGLFDAATGNVLAGPPTRPLPLIEIEIRDGTIYAKRQVQR